MKTGTVSCESKSEDSSKIHGLWEDEGVDFDIFSCSATGNNFLTHVFNHSGLVFPCLN